MKTIEELANLGAAAAALKNPETFLIGISPESQFWKGDQPAREAFARAVRDAVLSDNPEATALEAVKQLECMNEAQYRGIKSIADLLGVPPKDESISAVTKAVESLLGTVAQLREGNENLKASWDREIVARTEADAKLTAADVPTWRPIAEFREDGREYVFWDGAASTSMTPQRPMPAHQAPAKITATHFIVPPTTKPDPFDVWWATQNRTGKHKAECLEAWNAAVASTSEKEFYEEAAKLVGRPINLP